MGVLGAEGLLPDLKRFFEEGLRLGVSSDLIGKVTRHAYVGLSGSILAASR